MPEDSRRALSLGFVRPPVMSVQLALAHSISRLAGFTNGI